MPTKNRMKAFRESAQVFEFLDFFAAVSTCLVTGRCL